MAGTAAAENQPQPSDRSREDRAVRTTTEDRSDVYCENGEDRRLGRTDVRGGNFPEKNGDPGAVNDRERTVRGPDMGERRSRRSPAHPKR